MDNDITAVSSRFLDLLSRHHQAVPPALVGAALDLVTALNADLLLRAAEQPSRVGEWAARRHPVAIDPEPPIGENAAP